MVSHHLPVKKQDKKQFKSTRNEKESNRKFFLVRFKMRWTNPIFQMVFSIGKMCKLPTAKFCVVFQPFYGFWAVTIMREFMKP